MRRASHDTPDLFLVDDEGGAGLTRKQTRGAGFVAPSRGVRVRREHADDRGLLAEAALAASKPSSVMTDVSAAAAWGAPTPPWLRDGPEKVSVAVPAGGVEPRRTGVRGRRLELPSDHVTVLQGQRITTPGRTWLDCAAQVPLGYVVAMGDWIVRYDLATMDELAALCRWALGAAASSGLDTP